MLRILTKTDTSRVRVSITAPPNPVVLLSPNGSESFIAGTTQQINYQYGSYYHSELASRYVMQKDQGWQGLT